MPPPSRRRRTGRRLPGHALFELVQGSVPAADLLIRDELQRQRVGHGISPSSGHAVLTGAA
jgi:hypothetical protein